MRPTVFLHPGPMVPSPLLWPASLHLWHAGDGNLEIRVQIQIFVGLFEHSPDGQDPLCRDLTPRREGDVEGAFVEGWVAELQSHPVGGIRVLK